MSVNVTNSAMFDCFYLYEPEALPAGKFSTARALWKFPEDIERIPKPLQDVHEFCFPDLDSIGVEIPEASRTETYSFIVGREHHGICLRGLILNPNSRYDVGRRCKQCLVIVTKHPYFQFFEVVLHQIRGMALLLRGGSTMPSIIRGRSSSRR